MSNRSFYHVYMQTLPLFSIPTTNSWSQTCTCFVLLRCTNCPQLMLPTRSRTQHRISNFVSIHNKASHGLTRKLYQIKHPRFKMDTFKAPSYMPNNIRKSTQPLSNSLPCQVSIMRIRSSTHFGIKLRDVLPVDLDDELTCESSLNNTPILKCRW